jgi:hypothetical protein
MENGQGTLGVIIYFALVVLMIVSFWRVFVKANEPGWASIIPVYNLIVLLRIVDKPWWWFFLLLIPLVNIVIAIIVMVALAKSFDKGGMFAVGLLLLPFIFYPILAFGDAEYVESGLVEADVDQL